MKANGLKGWAVTAGLAVVLGVPAMGQATAQTAAAGQPAVAGTPEAAQVKRMIVVSLEDRKLALIEDGKVEKIYTVAIGKPSTPSPTGTFTIQRRVKDPVYRHEGKVVEPGPGNPVGSRWMGLSIKGYGIHGTNAPKSIGKAASHGCIRMGKADVEDLFDRVQVGDTVELIGSRNEQTAELFNEPKPAATDEPVVTATATVAPAAAPATTAMTTDATVEGVAVTGNW
jgi:lipoprotein-anchoring transpeptidase ErfK/SrfK